MAKEVNFGTIARRFDVNINALRVFNNQIGRLAEEHDKNTTEQQNLAFTQLVGISMEELEKIKVVSGEDLQLALKASKEASEQEKQEIEERLKLSDEQKLIVQKLAQIDGKDFLLRSSNFFRSTTKILPIQAYILRHSALTTLASHFEYLISELVHSFYSLFPQALPSEERVLSLAELREIGSIEDAENHLIEKEVDSLLRDTVEKQLEYFSSKRIKVNLEALSPYKNSLIEIFQRRNIIVHNDGVANKIYLSRVPQEAIEDGIKDGSRLDVTEEYLNKAIDNIYLSGIILVQLCWRKWQKENTKSADLNYINLLYETLQEQRFYFTKLLQEFSLKTEYITDRNKRVVIINHAIALRELNQRDEMEKLINSLDWSSCALEFKVALFSLREDKENFFKALPKAISANEIQKQHLEEWPLFNPFRELEEFIQIKENCPNEIIISE